MCVLVDWQLEAAMADGSLGITWPAGFAPPPLQPHSIDVRWGQKVVVRHVGGGFNEYDLRQKPYILYPGDAVLACTLEHLAINGPFMVMYDGCSSLARCFVSVHATSGMCDYGWHGNPTAEVTNHHRTEPYAIKYGGRAGQLIVHRLAATPRRRYGDPTLGSHYQGDTEPQMAWWSR